MESIKVIAGPLLVNCFLPTSGWGQADLHTPDLWLTVYPLYAFSTWESMKISYLRKIGLRYICTNLTTTTYIDGYTQETGDQCEVSIFDPSIVKYWDLIWRIYLWPECWFYLDKWAFLGIRGRFEVPYIMLGNYLECIRHFKLRITYSMNWILSSKNY
jgi:hypothetical protein